jgi:hypothetical protein
VSSIGREPEAELVASAGNRRVCAGLMVALILGLVELVEDGRRIVGVPDGYVFLGGRVEAAIREGCHRRLRNLSLETLELRGGEDRPMRYIGHVLSRSGDAAIGRALEADGRASR